VVGLAKPPSRFRTTGCGICKSDHVHRLAEVGVGVGVDGALGRGGQAQLHGRREVVQDRAPRALVPGAATVALVDDDEVEEVTRVVAEVRLSLTIRARAAHEGLEDGEEDAAVLRHPALLADVAWVDANQRIVGEGREGVVGLIGQVVAVCQEQHARASAGRRAAAPVGQVPMALEQLPGALERAEGFAGAGGQGQQDAVASSGDGFEHARNGDVLVVAALPGATLVRERDGREAVAPGGGGRVRVGEGHRPQLIRRGVAGHVVLDASGHVDAVDGLPVGAVREAHGQLGRIVLGLTQVLGVGLVPGLGLDHRQLGVPVDQHVVGDVGLRALPPALQPTRCDHLAPDPAAVDHAPTSGFLARGRCVRRGSRLRSSHCPGRCKSEPLYRPTPRSPAGRERSPECPSAPASGAAVVRSAINPRRTVAELPPSPQPHQGSHASTPPTRRPRRTSP